jgi:hypothetical protein
MVLDTCKNFKQVSTMFAHILTGTKNGQKLICKRQSLNIFWSWFFTSKLCETNLEQRTTLNNFLPMLLPGLNGQKTLSGHLLHIVVPYPLQKPANVIFIKG